jgi:hypothetical protein
MITKLMISDIEYTISARILCCVRPRTRRVPQRALLPGASLPNFAEEVLKTLLMARRE